LAMAYIPAAIAYPLYAGLSLVLAQALNYAQEGSRQPEALLLGLILVGMGLLFLCADVVHFVVSRSE
jgi:multidrug transporter EmrE-like cation transporter